MKLVLYSKLEPEINLDIQSKINNHLKHMIKSNNPSVGLIEHTTDRENKYYKRNLEFYNNLGIYNILRFDLDKGYNNKLEKDLFKCDIIHLSGGNTYYFLYMLKKRNLIQKLKDYCINGGILVGVSAGALIASPTIGSARYGDENEVGLTDLSALNLVNFEIMPHWNRWRYYLEDLKYYSKVNNITIYTVEDGQGIVIEDDSIKFYGDIGIIKK